MSITRRYYRTLPRWGKCLSRRFVAVLGKPAGLWLPNDVVNKAYDFSSNRNIGTLNGGITTASVGHGVTPISWLTDGSTGWIKGSMSGLPALNAASLSICVRFLLPSPNLVASINALASIGGSNGISMSVQSGDIVFVNNGGANRAGGSSLSANTWYEAWITQASGASPKIYLNGADVTSSPASTSPAVSITTWSLGAKIDGTGFCQAYITYGAIFPYTVTLSQVQQHYVSWLTGEPFPLFAPQTVRRGFGIKSIVGGSSFKFRRTLSDYGTRVGSRQAI